MSITGSILGKIQKKYEVNKIGECIYNYEIVTPAHTFKRILFLTEHERIYISTCREGYDLSVVNYIYDEIKNYSGESFENIQMIQAANKIRFWGIAIPRINIYDVFKDDIPELVGKIETVIPVYHHEFGGHEDEREFEKVIHSCVTIVDWDRMPAPKIKMQYYAAGINKKPKVNVFTNLQQLKYDLGYMFVHYQDKSWVKIENYRKDVLTLTKSDSKWYIETNKIGQNTFTNVDDLRMIVHDFLTAARE